ncbi:hypothetical protein U27_05534 [Candidatus Vecturithrix granuli]|uniref:Uncharacterized protein n=1 Tax=Vecturithrix granuli TaxID=1499967 RepID=A0A081C1V5_VECG1|nr:hypothetical protein U27_05534 [Candidatus Vecturithrix granuli]
MHSIPHQNNDTGIEQTSRERFQNPDTHGRRFAKVMTNNPAMNNQGSISRYSQEWSVPGTGTGTRREGKHKKA